MKNFLLIVTLPAMLTACATWPSQSVPEQRDASSASTSSPRGKLTQGTSMIRKVGLKSGDPAKEDDPLPALELTEDIIYKLLASEISSQRGDWQTGYITTLSLAQQTRDPRLARRAAEMALTAKRAEEALSAVRLWRDLAPHSDEASQYYLSLLVIGGNLAEVKGILAQRLQEARPQTRGLMAYQTQRLLTRANDKAAAFATLEEVLAPYQELPEAHLALAQSAFTLGDMARAKKEAQIALQIKPDSELGILTMAQAIQDKDEANKALADFLTRYPQSRDVRIAYARILVDQKQYIKARNEFELLLKEQPEDLTSLFALGILSTQLNDMPTAEKYLTTYVNLLPGQPDDERDPTQALLILAQIAEERKDTEAALKWLSQIEPGEGYFNAQIKRVQINAKRGDLPLARKMLHEIPTANEQEKAQLIIAEGQLLRDAGKLQDALNVVHEGLKRFPDNTDLLYDYAMLAEKKNQLDVMENSLRKIIKLTPTNPHAYNALGYSFAERNIRLDEAYTLIEKALSLAPEDPFIMDSMGWVQYRRGKTKEAEAILRHAYEIRPDAEIAVHLGEVLWVTGQKDAAQKFWLDARNKDPQSDALKSTLVRLNVKL